MPIMSNQKLEEMRESITRPFIEEISRLEKEIEKAHRTIQEYEAEIKRQAQKYENKLDDARKKIEFLKSEFQKREANMQDMLDRFASKSFENTKRGEYYNPQITEWKNIRLKNGYKKVVSFTVLFPIPTRNDVFEVNGAMEYIESLMPSIAKQMKVERLELLGASARKNGWVAKFETVVETVNQRRDLW